MDLTVLTPEERAQYDLDIQKGIKEGTLFDYHGGYSNQTGTFVVTGFYLSTASKNNWGQMTPACLHVHARRIVDSDGNRIKNSKVVRTIKVREIRVDLIWTSELIQKVYERDMETANRHFEWAVKHAAEKRDQLLSLLR